MMINATTILTNAGSLFTALSASYWALYMRSLISFKNVLYSAVTAFGISASPIENANQRLGGCAVCSLFFCQGYNTCDFLQVGKMAKV